MFCSNCGRTIEPGVAFCTSCGAPQAAAAPPAPRESAAQQYQTPPPPAPVPGAVPYSAGTNYVAGRPANDYATWATRAIGYIIDNVLVAVLMMVLYLFAGGIVTGVASLAGRDAGGGMCCVVVTLFPLATLLVGIYNRVYLVSQRGYSIGQGIVKVKVIDANGQLLSQGTAFIRLLAQVAMGFVPLLPLLDHLWPLWDNARQTLHDKAVGSYVINNPQP